MFLIIVLNLKMEITSTSILDEKVENVIDKDHVIEALKNGIHLNDYMKKTED